jgi:hypothetical protein
VHDIVPVVTTDRREWLSITPEPEGELPVAIATLRAGGQPDAAQIRAERERAERMITRARRRAYRRWLADARRLAADPPANERARDAARVTNEVLDNHDALALGITTRGRGGREGGDR